MYICPCCNKAVQPDATQCIHCGVRFASADNMVNNAAVPSDGESHSSGTGWKVVCIILIAVVASAITIGAIFGFSFMLGTPKAPVSDSVSVVPEISSEVVIPSVPSEPVTETGEYMLYGSDSRYIRRSELVGMSKWELRIARNEIYARHGRKFKDANLQSYFNNQSWYYGYINPGDFDDSVLNEYEKANITVITDYETEMGYRQ